MATWARVAWVTSTTTTFSLRENNMELPPNQGGDKGFFTEGVDASLGKRTAAARFDAGPQSVKAARIESVAQVIRTGESAPLPQVEVGYEGRQDYPVGSYANPDPWGSWVVFGQRPDGRAIIRRPYPYPNWSTYNFREPLYHEPEDERDIMSTFHTPALRMQMHRQPHRWSG